MHQNKPGTYANQLSSHASLLLSASPTIVTSPLQNNTNNQQPQTSSQPPSVGLIRRQPSTPLLPSGNLDNDSHLNTDSPTNISLPDGYINFKKPQNEIFKRLDGKIQKIVAAHSNLNKLYALNDFSGGAGPRRPFELPAQLPPPPPWIPKVASDHPEHWSDESHNPSSTSPDMMLNNAATEVRPGPSILDASSRLKMTRERPTHSTGLKSPSHAIDSAISKLHQRKLQQMSSPKALIPLKPSSIPHDGPESFKSSLIKRGDQLKKRKDPEITNEQLVLLMQKVQEMLNKRVASGESVESILHEKKDNKRDKSKDGEDKLNDKKEFKEKLMEVLNDEIASVANTDSLTKQSSAALSKTKPFENKSLLMKSSPQTLFNTIRRETSILLRKQGQASKLNAVATQEYGSIARQDVDFITHPPVVKIPHTIKVIVAPTETQNTAKLTEADTIENTGETIGKSIAEQNSKLTYQVIKNKIRSFQEVYHVYLGSHRSNLLSSTPNSRKKKSTLKSLDKIVDRLQAKFTPSIGSIPLTQIPGDQSSPSFQQRLFNTSANILSSSEALSAMLKPSPIPVFRSPLTNAPKGSIHYSSGVSKASSNRLKKGKRLHHFGLKLGNYLEKECPQPTADKISIEQYAKCLDLVRANDVSLQRHQEQLHADNSWRLSSNNRPLRLRRIRGEKIHMPASASYRATRKVGLQ